MTEHDLQRFLFTWVKLQLGVYPELKWLAGIPNGGFRHPATAKKMKAEGVNRGFPDVILPVKNAAFAGLAIEHKVGQNKPTEEQIGWLEHLASQDWQCVVVWDDWERSANIILEYLGYPKINQSPGGKDLFFSVKNIA